jgi:AcrR family transcriptional regulator
MPKQVDHDERRRQIVEALFRVAVRDGLAAATFRTVATEAGVPASQVQYYFGSKADLLDGALLELGRRVVGRGLARIAEIGSDAPGELFLRAAIEGARPSDDERRQELVLFFLFLVESLAEQSGSNLIVDSQRFIVSSFADVIRRAQANGETRDGIDPEHEARLILFANTGITLGALLGIHTVDDGAATMEYVLEKLFRS